MCATKTFTGYVYRFYHTASGKSYVGSTVNIKSRQSGHLRALRKGSHHCVYLQNAWNKHGESAFAFEVLEEIIVSSDAELRAAENAHFSRFTLYNTAPVAGTALGVTCLGRRAHRDPPFTVEERLFNKSRAASYLGICVRTLDRWIGKGRLKVTKRINKSPRWSKQELDAALAGDPFHG